MSRTRSSAPPRGNGPGRATSCNLGSIVRGVQSHRTPSDDAVREGNVVLSGFRSDSQPGVVRRAGEAVLLLGARDERLRRTTTPAALPLRLSKFHAPEIVFGPDSV
jgi:hypothetical protein